MSSLPLALPPFAAGRSRPVFGGNKPKIEVSACRPHVVLLDIAMPGPDGFEVCRRLRLGEDAAIIMLTARDDVTDKVSALNLGADDYVAKPFAFDELVARIHAVLHIGHLGQKLEAHDDPRLIQTIRGIGYWLSVLLNTPTRALADDYGSTVPPNPIPFGDGGTHHFLPGRGKEVTTITDFVGFVGVAQLIGTGTGTDTSTGATTPLNWSIDNRFITGKCVGVDGQERSGTFGVF